MSFGEQKRKPALIKFFLHCFLSPTSISSSCSLVNIKIYALSCLTTIFSFLLSLFHTFSSGSSKFFKNNSVRRQFLRPLTENFSINNFLIAPLQKIAFHSSTSLNKVD